MDTNERLRSSRFNLVTAYEATSELLIFNTLTGALIALPNDLGLTVSAVLAGELPIAALDSETAEALHNQGILIGRDTDEDQLVVQRHELGVADPNRLDVFLLPNMNCNFACPYCYEDHAPSQMSDEVEARILTWFTEVAPRFKVVLLSWFGGEPMLSFERVLSMQRSIKRICDEAGTIFNSHMTTNGYLLSPERARKLCDADLLSYQITVDGPPDIHNQRRLLKGPGDSFDRVFGNLCDLAEAEHRANIKLRVNFDPITLRRVPELLEMVPRESRPRIHLVLERLFGQSELFIGRRVNDVARTTEEVYEIARSMGFAVTTTPLEPGKLTYCYADREHEVVFNHLGDVFKCTVSKFTSDERLGVLSEDGRIAWDNAGLDSWVAIPAFETKCFSCTYQPMCMGGCRKSRGQIGTVGDDCTHPFAALDERVRRRYATMVGEVVGTEAAFT